MYCSMSKGLNFSYIITIKLQVNNLANIKGCQELQVIFIPNAYIISNWVKLLIVNSQNISDLKLSAKATDKDGAETVGTSKSSPIDVKTLPDKDDDQPRKSLLKTM